MASDPYSLTFRATAMGDECFKFSPRRVANPSNVTPLFGSAIAGVNRPTVGAVWRIEAEVLVAATTPVTAESTIASMMNMIDETKGTLLWKQGATTLKTFTDCLLDEVDPLYPDEPAEAKTVRVRLAFVTNKAPT